jgi:hypothetical protein
MKNVMADKMNPYPTFFLGGGGGGSDPYCHHSKQCPFFIFSRDFQLSLARYTLP